MKRTESDTAAARFARLGWLADRAVLFLTAARDGLPPRPGVALATMLLLIGLCMLLARPAAPAPDPAGFDLPADLSSSKLDDTSAEASASLSSLPPQTTLDVRSPGAAEESSPSGVPPAPVQVVPPPSLEVVPPVTEQPREPLLPPLEPPAPPVTEPPPPTTIEPAAVVPDPGDFDTVRYPFRGDTPMMYTWRMLGLQTLLAAALAAAPAVADVNQADPKKPDDLGKQLADMQKALEQSIKELRTDLNVYDQNTRAGLRELNDRVAQLEKQVKEMDARLNQMPTGRQAFSPPAATGRIRLMNMYNVPATVRVNRVAYRLQPGEQRMLEGQPVGAFTYEVVVEGFGQVQPPLDRVLGANDVFTIYVYPR